MGLLRAVGAGRIEYNRWLGGLLPSGGGCLNLEEFQFHPLNFKTRACGVSECRDRRCPQFHSRPEEEEFAALRAVLEAPSDPAGRLAASVAGLRECAALLAGRETAAGLAVAGDEARGRVEEEPTRGVEIRPARGGSASPALHSLGKSRRVGGFTCRPRPPGVLSFQMNSTFGETDWGEASRGAKLDLNSTIDFICAALNSAGGSGRLLFGVSEEGLVRGVALSRKDLDVFQVNLDIALRGVMPKVSPEQIQLLAHPIAYDHDYLIENRFLVELRVNGLGGDALFVTDRGDFVVQKPARGTAKLSTVEAIEFARQRSAQLPAVKLAVPALPEQVIDRMNRVELEAYLAVLEKTAVALKKKIASDS